MRYFLDCEFDGFGGKLLSMSLVPDQRTLSLYITFRQDVIEDPWVAENVVPLLDLPLPADVRVHRGLDPGDAAQVIADYLKGDSRPYIVSDWPDDIRYFCETVITGPGTMAPIKSLRFEMIRVDAYPTDLEGAVQHNAYWDSAALRDLLLPKAA